MVVEQSRREHGYELAAIWGMFHRSPILHVFVVPLSFLHVVCFKDYTEEFRDISKGKSKESVPSGIMLINQRPVGEDSHVGFYFVFNFQLILEYIGFSDALSPPQAKSVFNCLGLQLVYESIG